jgi:hypothetical protein
VNSSSHVRPWLSVLFAAWALLLGRGFTMAQAPDPRLERIFGDWEKRQQRIQTVRYRVRGEHVTMKGTDTGPDDRPLKPPSPPATLAGRLNGPSCSTSKPAAVAGR